MATVTVTIRFAWWLRWYLSGLQLTCWTMGAEPDMDKVKHTIVRAAYIEVVPVGRGKRRRMALL